jgi:hypothetical protein
MGIASAIVEIIRDLLIFVAAMLALLIALAVVISKMPDDNPLKRLLSALSYRVGATAAAGVIAIPIEPIPGLDTLYDVGVPIALLWYWFTFFREAVRAVSSTPAHQSPLPEPLPPGGPQRRSKPAFRPPQIGSARAQHHIQTQPEQAALTEGLRSFGRRYLIQVGGSLAGPSYAFANPVSGKVKLIGLPFSKAWIARLRPFFNFSIKSLSAL